MGILDVPTPRSSATPLTDPPAVLPRVTIDTVGAAPILDRVTYIDATITINGTQPYSGTTQIRGRGNTTWAAPKKPYRLKLTANASLLGMPPERDWVLLASAADPTKLRTAVAMEIAARRPGLSWTPRMRFVEVVLNGDFIGLYLLGEHVEIGANKVNVTKASGTTGLALTGAYFLEIDHRYAEDGGVGFRTTLKNVPISMDDPDGATAEQKTYIQGWINDFEAVLYGSSWLDPTTGYARLIDRNSFIDWYLVNELVGNVESAFNTSCRMTKIRDTATVPGKLVMGPVWDFDNSLGQDSRGVALSPTALITRSTPGNPGAFWFDRMFTDPAFLDAALDRWTTLRADLSRGDTIAAAIDRMADRLDRVHRRDQRRWAYSADLGLNSDDMRAWLRTRMGWLGSQLVIDTTAPTVPTALTASPGDAQITLTWTASIDAIGVTGYKVRQDGTAVATASGTTHTATGLTNGTSYSFTVSALDAAGNESAETTAVSATPAASGISTETFTGADGAAWPGPWVGGGGSVTLGGNRGRLVTSGAAYAKALASRPGLADGDMLVTWRWQAAHTERYAYFRFRHATSGDRYELRMSAAADFLFRKIVSGTTTSITGSGGTWAAAPLAIGTFFKTRLRWSGTTIQVRTWLAMNTEPSTWDKTITDSALSAAGNVGFTIEQGNDASVAVAEFDDFSLVPPT